MHGAVVVPHYGVAGAPMVTVDELRLGRNFAQFIEQRSAFRFGHAKNLRRRRHPHTDIERLASGLGMRAHHGMDNVGQCGLLFIAKRRQFLGKDAQLIDLGPAVATP